MSEDRSKLYAQGEEVLAILKRGADFTREVLQENERLRAKLAHVHDRQNTAARSPEEWSKLRIELLERIASLEEENRSYRERLLEVEEENRRFADRYVEIEEENNNLANLYVASYQLHSTLDLDEVLKIVIEIVINLIGAEVFAIYLLGGRDDELQVVAAEGVEASEIPSCQVGSGAIGEAVTASDTTCFDTGRSNDYTRPIVVIPLQIQKRPMGAIAIFSLLQQKEGFSALDHELFNLLGGHAATAIFASRLYSQSERKLSTIQGFLDLLAR
jgi:nitrate/nitrite-specific signal transduction histidine kinase